MALSISVSASVQTSPPTSGTAATTLKPGKRTFSLTGVLGTTFVKGDVVGLWGSNDGGTTYQPLRKGNNEPVQLNYYNPEVVIDDACDHYATQRLAVGSGSALASVGFNGETVSYTAGAWLVGGNNLGGAVGVLGTLDASTLQIKANNITVGESDGITTTIGNLNGASVAALLGGTGGVAMAAAGAGGVQIIAGATAAVAIEGGTSGVRVGANALAQAIQIGNATGATSVDIQAGTGAVNVGANAVAHTVTIGSVTGAAATSLRAGTGGLAIVNNGATWSWPTSLGGAGTKLTDAAGNGVLSFA